MKVCIIGLQNIKHMTLISLYTNFFDYNRIDYDLIYIDKYGITEESTAKTIYKFDGTEKKYFGKIGKILKALKFKKYVINILENNNYDFIVIWREETACIFSKYLSTHYKGKYSVNIRDLWNMKNFFMTRRIECALKNSRFNTISSEGFLDELPKADYLMLHSANEKVINEHGIKLENKEQDPIKITYIGTVRFYKYCFRLVEFFSNDSRFQINFIGQGSEIIEKYILKKRIKNVKCTGAFSPRDTMKLLEGTHIINCAFGNKNLAEKRLVPIRFYYALYKSIPILTTENTWLDTLGNKLEMSITLPNILNKDRKKLDDIYNRYKSIINNKGMIKKIKDYKEEIEESHRKLDKILTNILVKKS